MRPQLRRLALALAAIAGTALSGTPAVAQPGEAAPDDDAQIAGIPGVADALKPDRFVPEAPALALLGLGDASLASVANPADLGLTALTHVDENGRLQWGGAASGRPFWWGHRRLTINQYRDYNRLQRIVARLQVSAASTEVALGDDTALRVALGAHMQLLDRQDPRMANQDLGDGRTYGQCVQAGLTGGVSQRFNEIAEARAAAELAAVTGTQPGPREVETYLDQPINGQRRSDLYLEESIADAADQEAPHLAACNERWNRYSERVSSAVLGLGTSLQSATGQFDGFEQDATTVWFAYRHGIPDFMQPRSSGDGPRNSIGTLGLVVRYDMGGEVEAPSGGTTDASTASVALAFRRERGNLAAEAGFAWYDREYDDPLIDDVGYTRAGISIAYRLADRIPLVDDGWLELSWSHASDLDLENEDRIMLQFRCGDAQCFR